MGAPRNYPDSLPMSLRRIGPTEVRERGRSLVYFAGCDYFGLSTHPKVLSAARSALDSGGLSVGASRCTTGNHPSYAKLERKLADFFSVPEVVLTSTGYLSNFAVAAALRGRFTHALIDQYSHGSLQDAVQLLGIPIHHFGHRDVGAAVRFAKMAGPEARLTLLTDGMFAHDGAAAPLAEYRAALPARTWLWVDDAHSAGVLGANGRGTVELAGLDRGRVVQTGTLSKAFGSYGGFILAPHGVLAAVISQSSAFVGSTPLPPSLVAGALAAVSLLGQYPEWRAQLLDHAEQVRVALGADGWRVHRGPSPVISVVPPNPAVARQICQRLRRAGIHPPFIKYPGGPSDGYFRLAISRLHTPLQLKNLVAAFRKDGLP